jgi:heme-degrading monooxygenase HmoA
MTAAILINAFRVPVDREAEFLRLWEAADALLRVNGGYATTRLHRALDDAATFRFVNVAELDSVEHWRAVITGAEFRTVAAEMAEFRSTPALYTVAREHRADGVAGGAA